MTIQELRQKASEWQHEADGGVLRMQATYRRMADAYLMMAAMDQASVEAASPDFAVPPPL